jgi:hypothetical protein
MKQNTEAASQILFAQSETQYSGNYPKDYLRMYRDFVASADAISVRRNTANGFFLTLNTAFLGARGYFEVNGDVFVLIQAVAGVLFCLVWWRMIQSYRTLNGSKFRVIQMMERGLPLAPYTAEEYVNTSGPTLHLALSSVESLVPALFALLHLAVAVHQVTHR